MSEPEEVRRAYAVAKVGDPPIFGARFMIDGELDPYAAMEFCRYEWNEDPADPPIQGDVWSCTRAPGHKGPHVAEGFRCIYAVLWE